MDWICRSYEGPETEVLVGRPVEDARRIAADMDGIQIVEELGAKGTISFDHRLDRLRLLVLDNVVMAAARWRARPCPRTPGPGRL